MLYDLEEICIEITNKCYSKCIHCSSDAQVTRSNELNLTEIKNLIDQAAILSLSPLPIDEKNLTLDEIIKLIPTLNQKHGEGEWEDALNRTIKKHRQEKRGKPVLELSGGEPILRPDVYEIAQYGKNKGFRINLYTAGIKKPNTGISDEDVKQWKKIFDADDTVAVSVEGAREEIHDKITNVQGHFRIIMDAIDLFLKNGITVTAHCTPTKINYKDIPDLVELLDEMGVKEVAFLRLVPQGRALQNLDKLMLSKEEFMELQRIISIEWMKAEEGSRGIKVRWGCPIDFRHLLYPVGKKPCHGGRDTIVVRPDGNLHPCPAWKEIHQMTLGNIRESSLVSVWLDSEILNLFRSFTFTDLQGECYWCASKSICGGGCPAQRILVNSKRGIRKREALLAVGPDPLCFKELL